MKNKERSENRKALPKFLGLLLLGGLVGGVCGGVMGFLGGTSAPDSLVEAFRSALGTAIPWAIWIFNAALLAYGLFQYRKAKSTYAGWDGEEEETVERAEEACNFALVASSLLMLLSFFFYGAYGAVEKSGRGMLAVLLGFAAAIAGVILLQQRVVDLIKQFNPEKRGSVFDPKFQKTWLESCDENEQRQVGQAAMKAFTAVNYACVALWAVVVLFNVTGFGGGAGVLPVFLVTVIWGVAQIAYQVEAIRLGRHK